MPLGSRKVRTSSSSRVVGASVSTSSRASRSCHHPRDDPGTLNAVVVVRPAPWRPLATPGQGKNVSRLDGLPCSSPYMGVLLANQSNETGLRKPRESAPEDAKQLTTGPEPDYVEGVVVDDEDERLAGTARV